MSGAHSPHPPTATPDSGRVTVIPLNALTRSLDAEAAAGPLAVPSSATSRSKDQLPCFVLLDDAWRGSSHLQNLFEGMQCPLYGVSLPQVCTFFLSFDLISKGSGGKLLLLSFEAQF